MDFKELRLELIAETKKKISDSVGADNLISQAINSLSEIDKANNILAKRLREWYELYFPELSRKVADHQRFVSIITAPDFSKDDNEYIMGAKLPKEDVDAMISLANRINDLYQEKESITDYIKLKMESFCPHLLEVCGPLVGAKILAHKGTLRELAFMPASTIQLLGAEKALFRHIKTNARPPKYGYILQHQDVSAATNKGKAARQLANKISTAAKQDYFAQQEDEE